MTTLLMIMKTILYWLRNIDRFIKKCEMKEFLPKRYCRLRKSLRSIK